MAPPTTIELVPEGDCLVWSGKKDSLGYGKCCRTLRGTKYWLAHRWAWASTNGDIPEGLLVCHTCDNPPCCNPAHLFLGTDKDNAIDRATKGRSGPRASRREHLLSDEELSMAMQLLSDGATQREVAERFGVSQPTISYHFRRRAT